MRKYLILIIFLPIFLISPFIVKSFAERTSSAVPQPQLEAEKLTTLVNEWRVKSGFQSYIKNEALCTIAKERVIDQLNGLDNHQGLYETYSQYPSVISENTVGPANTIDPEGSALTSWLISPPHRATLEKSYLYSCIATKNNYAVQIFSNCENGCL